MTLPVWRASGLTTLCKCDLLHRSVFFLPITNCISGAIWNRASVFAPKITFLQSDKEMADYAELVRDKWQEKISEYLEENAFDRTALDQMIAAIRTGKMVSFHTLA